MVTENKRLNSDVGATNNKSMSRRGFLSTAAVGGAVAVLGLTSCAAEAADVDQDPGQTSSAVEGSSKQILASETDAGRFEAGLARLNSLSGKDLRESMLAKGPLGEFTCSFVYGDIFGREGLSVKWREIVIIAIQASLQITANSMKNHMDMAIRNGATYDELEETLLMVAAYAGFPAALSASDFLAEFKPE